MIEDSTTTAAALSQPIAPAAAHAQQTKHLTIYWVIDESGSMRMDRMAEALQTALAQGLQKLARPRPAYASLELFTRTLCFGQTIRWDGAALTSVRTAKAAELLPYGQTNIAPALRELTREIQARSVEQTELPPVIVLFSDGLPTDSYTEALAEFDTACSNTGAIRLSVAIGRLKVLAFCREFTGDSPFDCMSAPTTATLSRVVDDLCGSVLPAFLTRASGEEVSIPLEPAWWMPHIFSASIRGKRLSSQLFQTQSSRQVADGLAAAVIADLTLHRVEDDLPRTSGSPLNTLLLRSREVFGRISSAQEASPEDEEIMAARLGFQEQGIRDATISTVFARGHDVFLKANQILEVANAAGATVTVETVGPTTERSSSGEPKGLRHARFIAIPVARPCVILIASQSMRGAFGSAEDFGQVAKDLLRLSLPENGMAEAEAAFNTWLQKASAISSDAIGAVVLIFHSA